MKKLIFMVALAAVSPFMSCGNKVEDKTIDSDSIALVDSDSVIVDSIR